MTDFTPREGKKPTLKIGSPIWVFDPNRRVYPKNRTVASAPIWREHWVKMRIVADTRVSWLYAFSEKSWSEQKVPKRVFTKPYLDLSFGEQVTRRGFALSNAEIGERERAKALYPKVIEAVRRCDDPALVFRIAELLKVDVADEHPA